MNNLLHHKINIRKILSSALCVIVFILAGLFSSCSKETVNTEENKETDILYCEEQEGIMAIVTQNAGIQFCSENTVLLNEIQYRRLKDDTGSIIGYEFETYMIHEYDLLHKCLVRSFNIKELMKNCLGDQYRINDLYGFAFNQYSENIHRFKDHAILGWSVTDVKSGEGKLFSLELENGRTHLSTNWNSERFDTKELSEYEINTLNQWEQEIKNEISDDRFWKTEGNNLSYFEIEPELSFGHCSLRISSVDLPEKNEMLYKLFPDLKQYRGMDDAHLTLYFSELYSYEKIMRLIKTI